MFKKYKVLKYREPIMHQLTIQTLMLKFLVDADVHTGFSAGRFTAQAILFSHQFIKYTQCGKAIEHSSCLLGPPSK